MGLIVNFSRISKSDNYAVINCIGLHGIGLGVWEGQWLTFFTFRRALLLIVNMPWKTYNKISKFKVDQVVQSVICLSLIYFVIVDKDFRADRSSSSVVSSEELLWLHSVWVCGHWRGPGGEQVCGCHQQHGLEVQHHYYWSAGPLSCKYSPCIQSLIS